MDDIFINEQNINEFPDTRSLRMKTWDVTLTVDEIKAEMQELPTYRSNLVKVYPISESPEKEG